MFEIEALEPARKDAVLKLAETISTNIADGFEEIWTESSIAWVVPHSTYPNGYHCTPSDPLPFITVGAQKKHIAVYHMGVYADPLLSEWFTSEYPKHVRTKLNMGKSCIRFTNPKTIPYDLIGELATRMTATRWIELYEGALKR